MKNYDDEFEFESQETQRAFTFLLSAFVKDYALHRLALEKAGWRTLTRVVNEGKVSAYSIYGKNRNGYALVELKKRGLVEARIYPGERGRGGKILKIRVCYDLEPIKRQIDLLILKPSKNDGAPFKALTAK